MLLARSLLMLPALLAAAASRRVGDDVAQDQVEATARPRREERPEEGRGRARRRTIGVGRKKQWKAICVQARKRAREIVVGCFAYRYSGPNSYIDI